MERVCSPQRHKGHEGHEEEIRIQNAETKTQKRIENTVSAACAHAVPKKKLSVVSCQLPEKKKDSFFARISPALATNN